MENNEIIEELTLQDYRNAAQHALNQGKITIYHLTQLLLISNVEDFKEKLRLFIKETKKKVELVIEYGLNPIENSIIQGISANKSWLEGQEQALLKDIQEKEEEFFNKTHQKTEFKGKGLLNFFQVIEDSQYYTELSQIKSAIERLKDRIIFGNRDFTGMPVVYTTTIIEDIDYIIQAVENTEKKLRLIPDINFETALKYQMTASGDTQLVNKDKEENPTLIVNKNWLKNFREIILGKIEEHYK